MGRLLRLLICALALAAVSVAVWRWAGREGVWRQSLRQIYGTVGGLLAFGLMVVTFVQLGAIAGTAAAHPPADLAFVAPVQQAGSALSIVVSNSRTRRLDGQSSVISGRRCWRRRCGCGDGRWKGHCSKPPLSGLAGRRWAGRR